MKRRLFPLLVLPLLLSVFVVACGQSATPGATPVGAPIPDIEATVMAAVAATLTAASGGPIPTNTPEPPAPIPQTTSSQSAEEARVQATIAALLATPASRIVSTPPATATLTPSPTAAPFPTAVWAPTQISVQPSPTPITVVTPPTPTATLEPTPTDTPNGACQLAPDGVPVTAWIDGNRVALSHVADGEYSLFIEQREGNSFAGKTVTFQIGADTANESANWAQGGGDELDLTANTGSAPTSSIPSDLRSSVNARGGLFLAQPLPPHVFLGTVSLCGSS